MPFKITKSRVEQLEEMGEEAVFEAWLEAGSLLKMAENLFEPHPDYPDGKPGYVSFYRWLENEEGRAERWKRFKKFAGHIASERAVDEAMEATPDNFQSQRLRYDAQKWRAGVYNRDDYGDGGDKVLESFGKALLNAMLKADEIQPDNRLPERTPVDADYEIEDG